MKNLVITKQRIKENTISKEVETGVFGRYFIHKCRIKDELIDEHYGILFEMEVNNPSVFAHFTQHTEVIGEASTKKEFIDCIYKYFNE